MVKEGADHQPVVIFTKENTDADKRIGGPSNQGITGNIQGDWD